MRKILLVMDDYNELVAIESFFRRLGFDVLSLNKDILVSDAILGFVPDLVVATAKGRMVDGMKVALKIYKGAPGAKLALVYPPGAQALLPPEGAAMVDAIIELPVRPNSIINLVCELCGLDPQPLLEKHERQSATRAKTNDRVTVFADDGGGKEVTMVSGRSGAHGSAKVSVESAASHASAPAGQTSGPGASSRQVDPTLRDQVIIPGTAATARTARSDVYDRFLKENDDGPVDGLLTHAKAADYIKKLKKESEAEWKELEDLTEKKREFVKILFREGQKKPKG